MRNCTRLEICGGIASGKTTLAGLLGDQDRIAVFEHHTLVPTWEAFHRDRERYAFETEIGFLSQHHSLIKESHRFSFGVFDFSMLQDMAYADVNLSGPKKAAFDAVYGVMADEVGLPRILVHLRCSAQEELRRIRLRGRKPEADITAEYLTLLNDAIAHRVDELPSSVKVITINSAVTNFADNPSERHSTHMQILDAIDRAREEQSLQ